MRIRATPDDFPTGAPRAHDSLSIALSTSPLIGISPAPPSRTRVIRTLQQAGYDVRYHEFEGPHTVPPDIARDAVDWFAPRPS